MKIFTQNQAQTQTQNQNGETINTMAQRLEDKFCEVLNEAAKKAGKDFKFVQNTIKKDEFGTPDWKHKPTYSNLCDDVDIYQKNKGDRYYKNGTGISVKTGYISYDDSDYSNENPMIHLQTAKTAKNKKGDVETKPYGLKKYASKKKAIYKKVLDIRCDLTLGNKAHVKADKYKADEMSKLPSRFTYIVKDDAPEGYYGYSWVAYIFDINKLIDTINSNAKLLVAKDNKENNTGMYDVNQNVSFTEYKFPWKVLTESEALLDTIVVEDHTVKATMVNPYV